MSEITIQSITCAPTRRHQPGELPLAGDRATGTAPSATPPAPGGGGDEYPASGSPEVMRGSLMRTTYRRVAFKFSWSSARTRTTRSPAAPSERGGVPVRMHSMKCSHSIRSGSRLEIRGLWMSPERVMYSP